MSEPNTSADDILAAFLTDSDVRCPACRYALRIDVGGADSANRSMWWIAAVYGMGTAVFLSLVLLTQPLKQVVAVLEDPDIPTMVSAGFASQSDLPQKSSIFIVIAINGVVGLILALLIRMREALARLNAFQQAALGARC